VNVGEILQIYRAVGTTWEEATQQDSACLSVGGGGWTLAAAVFSGTQGFPSSRVTALQRLFQNPLFQSS
jgi:hypothetical protein